MLSVRHARKECRSAVKESLEGDVKKDVGEAFGSRRIEGEGDELEGIGDAEGKVDERLHRKQDE